MNKHQVLELLIDAIEMEDWSLVEEAVKVIKGEDEGKPSSRYFCEEKRVKVR